MNLEVLPEFISGIATDKKEIAQRRFKLTQEYKLLLARLMNRNGRKTIFNEYLKVDVHLVMREGGKEATNRSSFNWQSAFAILNIETIIRKAIPKEGQSVYVLPKETGNQKAYKYVKMVVLYYEFKDDQKWYMNFTVRLMLGVKNDGRYIQYSVNKIDMI